MNSLFSVVLFIIDMNSKLRQPSYTVKLQLLYLAILNVSQMVSHQVVDDFSVHHKC